EESLVHAPELVGIPSPRHAQGSLALGLLDPGSGKVELLVEPGENVGRELEIGEQLLRRARQRGGGRLPHHHQQQQQREKRRRGGAPVPRHGSSLTGAPPALSQSRVQSAFSFSSTSVESGSRPAILWPLIWSG